MQTVLWREGGLEGFRNNISLIGVINPKAMKDDKGREGGGHNIGKMGRRRLWMAPWHKCIFSPFLSLHRTA